jgi:broad specificity phosphatase PhoE
MSKNVPSNRKKYSTFYIVIHGETEWNAKGLFQGIQDSALTPIGEKQAKILAAELKNVHFDVIFF